MLATRNPLIPITSLVPTPGSNPTFRHGTSDDMWAFLSRNRDEYSRNSHLQYINSANHSPCDVIKKMADFQEDGDQKLQIFAYLHVGVTTLSITIDLYSWYCFIYWNTILHVSGPLLCLVACTLPELFTFVVHYNMFPFIVLLWGSDIVCCIWHRLETAIKERHTLAEFQTSWQVGAIAHDAHLLCLGHQAMRGH